MKTYQVNNEGYYGEFGGAYIPEILHRCVEELRNAYLNVLDSEDFKQEFNDLLRHYVGRPSPLYLARRLSEKYGCKIYLKREDLNHTGAHKINNAIGQVLLAKRMGKSRIIAETGAGQHGVATATVCALMNMQCIVYMGKTDVERQHVNVEKMKMLGAEVRPVTSGNMTLKDATNEAIRDWCCHPADTYYVIGSTVGPHPYPDMVARLQSVISAEIRKQLKEHEGRDYPDYLMACVGGGSNAAGTIFHYIDDERVQIVLAEAGGKGIETGMSAATIQLGKMGIIHGAKTLVIQNKDGQIEEPYSISAGLDYPGIGPMHANLAQQKRAMVLAINDDEAIRAAFELTRLEGIIPALESAHALGALDKMHFRPEDVVVLTVSGRGDKDTETYLKAVCFDREVAEMEQGPDTVVGSGGVRLSGGQAKRLALARTLCHKRPVLILDDPFSALDRNTEQEVYTNLKAMTSDSIVILLSHRLYLFPEMDQVIWMEHGHAAVGTHEEIMEKYPEYARLYEEQTKGSTAEKVNAGKCAETEQGRKERGRAE